MSAAGESAEGELSYDPNRELEGTKGIVQGLAWGVSMRQGSRPYMEDVTVMQAVPEHDAFTVRTLCSGHPLLFSFLMFCMPAFLRIRWSWGEKGGRLCKNEPSSSAFR
jgi:hypothetical protein